MLEYEKQKRKIPKYTWYDLIQFSSIMAPGVMGYKKPNSSEKVVEANLNIWNVESKQCLVWQIYNSKIKKCITSPNTSNNKYSDTNICKSWSKLVNWDCIVMDENISNSVYKDNKIKDWITSVWIVIQKPWNTYEGLFVPKSENMSIDPNRLKNTKNINLKADKKFCEWWITSISWEIICPNNNYNFLNNFK